MIENQNPCANLTDNPQYLEWFLTRQQELLEGIAVVDLPVEQDVVPSIVPREKTLNGVPLPTVFVKDGEPSADVYKKLMYSTLFKANSASRARDTNSDYKTVQGEEKMLGGHVTVSTNLQAIARDNGDEDKQTRVPRTSQLTSADKAPNTAISGYTITTLSATPTDGIDVTRDVSVLTRSHYLTKLTDSFLNWIKDSFNKIKTYIDTVNVTAGTAVVSQTATAITVTSTAATGTTTKQFAVALNIFASIDPTFAGNSNTTLVAESAMKAAVDALVSAIDAKADDLDLTSLLDRVTIIEGSSAAEKADLTALTSLASTIANLASKPSNETITGSWTYSNPVNVPDGATGLQAVNKNTLTTVLAGYVTTTAAGNTTTNLQNSISALDVRITAIENTLANFPNIYYTKTEIDNLLLGKSDVGHTHTGTYQPFVAGGLSSTSVLRQNSTIVTVNGIVTGITT